MGFGKALNTKQKIKTVIKAWELSKVSEQGRTFEQK